jgi:hypothetical protein
MAHWPCQNAKGTRHYLFRCQTLSGDFFGVRHFSGGNLILKLL